MKLTPIHQAAVGLNAQFTDMGGWKMASVYSTVAEETKAAERRVALLDQSNNTQIIVEGDTAAAVLKKAKIEGHQIRPDLFIITAAPNAGAELITKLEEAVGKGKLVTVTETTNGNGNLRLIGPDSDDLLSRLCGLDLHDSVFPNGTAKISSVAKTRVTIVRDDVSGKLSYSLIGARSLSAYLWETILAAGADLSVRPIGSVAFEQLAI
ncbi:MAG: sarcosine oxidase subunit gamma family protein [Anaerolineae bacterium]